MSEERDDRILDAALGGRAGGLTPGEAREAARLRSALWSAAAGADTVPPPPGAKEMLMARIEADVRRRRIIPWALAASALIFAGAGLFAFRPGPSLRITALSGGVLANGRPVSPGDIIRPGAILETAPGAWARFVLGDRAAALLQEGGRLTLSRLRGGASLRLESGGLFSHVRPGTKFAVRTPAASAAVRGTTFYVKAESPERTYICLCEGRLHVETGGESRDMEAAHHTAVRANEDRLEEAGMEGHMDKDAESLALP